VSAPRVSNREFADLAGCDEKQVRRAIAAGKLVPHSDGTLDPALVNSGWRRPIRSSKVAADSADTSQVSAQVSAASVRTVCTKGGTPAPDIDPSDTPAQAATKLVTAFGAEHNLTEAIRLKENFNALLKQLEYEQKSGQLVDFETAQAVFFETFRAQRDTWLNWPIRIGPLLAADLGLEADKVTEVLTAHVHKQISSLGEPEANFSERQD
jgi:hypothetical protein